MRTVVKLLNMMFVGFSCGVLIFFAWMDEPFVAHKQVASCEGLGADFADERLLLGMSTNVSLKVFLCWQCQVSEWPRQMQWDHGVGLDAIVPAEQRDVDNAGKAVFWTYCLTASF